MAKGSLWKDFKAFISRGNVVDMAIGVVVANAFKDIITKFTNGFISPIVGLITDGVVLSELKYVLIEAVVDAEGTVVKEEVAFLWGALVQSIIDFLIIAAVLFIILKIFSSAAAKAKKLRETPAEKAAAEAAAAEAAAKAEADAKAAAAAQAKQEALEASTLAQAELLKEIRDLLKDKQ